MNYYIYYKVPPERVSALRPMVEHLFSTVEKRLGVRGRWMRRRDDPETYMEVYENVDDQAHFEWELADIADKLKVKEFLEPDTTRHCECFES